MAKFVGAVRAGSGYVAKVYGALRADVLQRIYPKDVRMTEGGLSAKLHRTETSGAGKEVRNLTVSVPAAAWILDPDWLRSGCALWSAVGDDDRDFFLPRPSFDLTTFTERAAEAADMAALNLRALEALKVPKLEDRAAMKWAVGDEELSVGAVALVWTGHSERATLASGLAALGGSQGGA